MRILVSGRGIPGRKGWSNAECLVRGFKKLGHDAHVYGNVYESDDPIDQYSPATGCIKPDLLVWTECNDGDPQYSELLDLDCPRVIWDFDTSMHEEFSRWLWTKFGRVYVANPNYRRDATYLPYGVDETLYYPGEQVNDVAIVGTPFKERVEFAAKAGVELVQGLYGEAYAAFLRSLKIGVHHHDSGGEGLLVARVWETMASGSVLVTHDNLSIRRHFTPGINVVLYDSPWDCRRRVEALLNDDEGRKNIAQNGYSEVLRRHTWTARARRIVADAGAL